MRTRLSALVALVAIGVLAATGVVSPVRADGVKKFEGHIAAPGAGVGHTLADEFSCPEPGTPNGSNYAFIDLEGDFTHFKVSGPPHLFVDPTGVVQWGDYDFDMYVYDAKCNMIGEGATPAGTEKTSTKKMGRFVVIDYFFGVQPNAAFTLEVANAPIK